MTTKPTKNVILESEAEIKEARQDLVQEHAAAKTTPEYTTVLLTDLSPAEIRAVMLLSGGYFTNDPKEFGKKIDEFLAMADEIRRVRSAR